MDVFHQRLEQEHGESVILTPPTVPYTLNLQDGRTLHIQNPSMYPTDQKVRPGFFASLGFSSAAPVTKPRGFWSAHEILDSLRSKAPALHNPANQWQRVDLPKAAHRLTASRILLRRVGAQIRKPCSSEALGLNPPTKR